MKFYRKKGLRKRSDRGEIIKQIKTLIFKELKEERGYICEIHNRECPSIGSMHILSVGAHPKLFACKENILLAGWFCSHFWTHHNPDDKRAIFVKERIKELRGVNYKENLLVLEAMQPKHSLVYLKTLLMALRKNEL